MGGPGGGTVEGRPWKGFRLKLALRMPAERQGSGQTQVSSHIRDRQESIGIAVPVYRGQK